MHNRSGNPLSPWRTSGEIDLSLSVPHCASFGHKGTLVSMLLAHGSAHPLAVTAVPGLEAGLCWGPGCLGSAEEAREDTPGGERRQTRARDGRLFKAVAPTSTLTPGFLALRDRDGLLASTWALYTEL